MPVLPLIGMSIVVHLLVILFASLFRMSRSPKKRRRKLIPHRHNEAFGKLIIVVIFGFAFVSAALMVRLSITEKHSTISFINDQLENGGPFIGIAEAVAPPVFWINQEPPGKPTNEVLSRQP